MKEFYGSGRYALAVAQGKVKLSGKIKGGFLDQNALNTLFFGTGATKGTQKAVYTDVTGSVIPATPFTVTPSIPNSGTIADDLGVMIGGVALTRVASAPTAGQYTYNAGVYTFAAADTGKRAYINFAYTMTASGAGKFDLTNLAMGATPRFKLQYYTEFQGKKTYIELASVVAPKLNLLGVKNDDYSIPEVEFQAQTDDTGNNVGYIMVSE